MSHLPPQKPAASYDFEQNPGTNLLTKMSIKLRMFIFRTRFVSENSSYTSLICTLHALPHGLWVFHTRSAPHLHQLRPTPLREDHHSLSQAAHQAWVLCNFTILKSEGFFDSIVSVLALSKEVNTFGFADGTRQEAGNIFLPLLFYPSPSSSLGFGIRESNCIISLLHLTPWFLKVQKHEGLLKFFQLSVCAHQLLCFFVINLLELCVLVLWIYYLDAFQGPNLGVFWDIKMLESLG